jgi:hypothetical protein
MKFNVMFPYMLTTFTNQVNLFKLLFHKKHPNSWKCDSSHRVPASTEPRVQIPVPPKRKQMKKMKQKSRSIQIH